MPTRVGAGMLATLTPTKSNKRITYPAFLVLGLGPRAQLRWA